MSDLTIEAPDGAHYNFEEVKTSKGATSLGEVPIMIWDDVDKAIAFYGEAAIRDVLDGTSLRVSFQSIARRYASAGKTNDEIAKAQSDFRPGKRAVGASTPASRSARLAKQAVEKGADSGQLEMLLAKIASGEIDMASLVGAANPGE